MLLRRAIVAGVVLLTAAGIGVSGPAAQSTASKSSKSSTTSKSRPTAKKTRSRTTRKKERGQTAPTPERISEIQQALAKDGSFGGTPNGKWDDSTSEAMKRFQAAHALNPSGKLDAPTLQKLGLGSQTAGVAAPTPPIGATSRLSRLNTAPAQTAERQ
jgi:peptidoglycan hydrolase-like protein with peptidoglycan-binding domain